ncbi:MAG TPA: restriction endonuclease subunit S [Candidatus Ligilactobacillus faecavium]|nr:restriction endonuclease subunit S [Candidatus Ligilactobacillus faecavium]
MGEVSKKLKSYSLTRSVESRTKTQIKYVHYGDIHTGIAQNITINNKLPWIKLDQSKEIEKLKRGDIIVADASEDYKGIADAALIEESLPYNIIAGLHTIAFRPNNQLMDSKFIFYSLQNINFKRYGYKIGTGLKVFGISANNFFNFNLKFPNILEQNKISTIINKLKNLLALYAKKSSCLDSCIAYFIRTFYDYQQFFKQKNVQSSIVKSFKLNDILIKNNIRNKDSSILNVESISNKEGFISQKKQFDNYQVASKDLSNYYVIHPKDFAYNPSRINVGSIAYKNPNDVKGIVSPLYVSFKCKNDIILDKYLWYWFKSANFEHQRVRLSEGGVRDTLSFNQLSKMKISIPSFEIQKQTIKFLEILIQYKEEIDLKLNNLKLIKNTLLQNMFL